MGSLTFVVPLLCEEAISSICTLYLQIRLISYRDPDPGEGPALEDEWVQEKMVKTEGEGEIEELEVVGAEGVGRATEVGGGVHPAGGTTATTSVAPTPEVQHAIMHAVDISAGRALPAKTITIAPVPGLPAPPPHPAPLPGPCPLKGPDPCREAGGEADL